MSLGCFTRRSPLALCTTVLVTLVVAGCGGDDEGGGGGSAAALGNAELAALKAKVDASAKPPAKIGPSAPIDKPIPADKHLVYVNCGAPACVIQGNAFKEAASALGWKVDVIDAQPTPQAVQAAMDEAIRRKPDGVASAGFGRSLYPRQLDQMKAMSIPVMSTTGAEESGEGGITLDPIGPNLAGESTALLADKTIVDANGKGEIGTVLLTGFPIVKEYTEAYENEIRAKCPDCTLKQLQIQPTSLGKDAAQKIANFLQANPNIEYLFLSYDFMGSGLTAAVKGAGLDMPKTYSWAPEQPGIEALKTGERTASIAYPFVEANWQLVDGFLRTFTGGDVNESQPLQDFVVWSKDFANVPQQGDPYPPIVADYEQQFKELWGVE
jgi:ribose transport system substrate-binding protein